MSNRSGKASGDANVLISLLGRVTVLVGIVFSTSRSMLCAQTNLPGASVVYEVIRRVGQIAFTAVLARLLRPEDFGLIAMALVCRPVGGEIRLRDRLN